MLQTTFLWYLVQLEHYQSLSLAAEKLHVSQPALSKGIKTLEEQLGTKLLERTYKGITLTEAGKYVVELAKPVFDTLNQIETAFQKTESTDESVSLNDLIIYCNPAYSPLLMSALSSNNNSNKSIIQFFDLTPDINTGQLLTENSNIVVLGIVSDSHELPNNALALKKLRSSKSYVACSNNFPHIAANKSTISFKELLTIPLAISTNALEFQKDLLANIQQYGKPNIKVLAPNFITVSAVTQSGIAASFSNKFYHSPENDSSRLIPIRNAPKVHLSLVYNRQLDDAKIELLAQLLDPYLI